MMRIIHVNLLDFPGYERAVAEYAKRISDIRVYTCLRQLSAQNGFYPFRADSCQEDKVNTGYRNP